ncbi:hypothetical protein CDAR_609791 [Caerostris darwini]|uniref:Uncharacterized protein n=1 Tax=Caerostris darwini TaxID=1538125 RepID=A0AAV4R1V5_9ARAC|nr:hypothetical protein CDAR_609791 [Caerostris darwini]
MSHRCACKTARNIRNKSKLPMNPEGISALKSPLAETWRMAELTCTDVPQSPTGAWLLDCHESDLLVSWTRRSNNNVLKNMRFIALAFFIECP